VEQGFYIFKKRQTLQMLHVCRKCEFLADGSINDFCGNCGAKNWVLASSWPPRPSTSPTVNTNVAPERPSEIAQGCVSLLLGAFVIAAGLGALWLIVAIIHWMWNHS
jgi:hypothetical protein